jgi:alanine racemase
MTRAETAGAILTIDLDAIAGNWRLLRDKLAPGAACAAVVKADAYGLGAARVAPALARAGCRVFFVATLDEGIALRAVLPEGAVHVLGAPIAGNEPEFAAHRLIPTLNSLDDVTAWIDFGRRGERPPPADLHVDTGMRRLGLSAKELTALCDAPERLRALTLDYLMSHLACADEPDHPLNREQWRAFSGAIAAVQRARGGAPFKTSFANSSGIFLGPDYHFDLARPGAALYGIAPQSGAPNPLAQVVRLQGKILQVRDVDTPGTVGYGATHRITRPGRIATVAAGYADGYPRSLSNRGACSIGDFQVPVVGRVSMDLITLDVTAVPETLARPGVLVDLIGPRNTVDAVGDAAGTIGYEVLTRLGKRYHRVYVGNT